MYKKKLYELTIKHSFMFGAVMSVQENCRLALERILGKKILEVHVSKEKSLVYHPEYKGIRLDIQAEDEARTVYNIEMQAINEDDLKKRSRYYHSQIDMELLNTGKEYSELPVCYVIFICDFDPFGKNLYRYTFTGTCKEYPELEINDGSSTIFLNTKGKNEDAVSVELAKFLKFIHADLEESELDFEDEFVGRLQQTVREIKSSKEMEMSYMQYNLLLRKERNAGKEEGKAEGKAEGRSESVLDLLSEYGEVPDNLYNQIMGENNLAVLKRWLKLAFRVESIEQFVKEM